MIPITQTVTGPRGNCMAACWASILEAPIEEVPDYQAIDQAGGSWLNAINVWLTKHYGLLYNELLAWQTPAVIPVGFHLINGDSPREGVGGHSVVGFMGRPIWDPHPARAGLRSVDNYGLLVPLNKSLRETWERCWEEWECLCGVCVSERAGRVDEVPDRKVLILSR